MDCKALEKWINRKNKKSGKISDFIDFSINFLYISNIKI